jgi:nucleotide-binding universal stress UspA family protein
MFNKILLATDGSRCALQAASKAIEIGLSNPKAKIHIVYVVDIAKAKTEVLQNWNSIRTQDKRKDKVKATEEMIQKAGIQYETHFLRGDPGPSIVKFANENIYDLVIVGNRRKNKLQQIVLGSVSHKVAKRVKCPVMIIKADPLYKQNIVSASRKFNSNLS